MACSTECFPPFTRSINESNRNCKNVINTSHVILQFTFVCWPLVYETDWNKKLTLWWKFCVHLDTDFKAEALCTWHNFPVVLPPNWILTLLHVTHQHFAKMRDILLNKRLLDTLDKYILKTQRKIVSWSVMGYGDQESFCLVSLYQLYAQTAEFLLDYELKEPHIDRSKNHFYYKFKRNVLALVVNRMFVKKEKIFQDRVGSRDTPTKTVTKFSHPDPVTYLRVCWSTKCLWMKLCSKYGFFCMHDTLLGK